MAIAFARLSVHSRSQGHSAVAGAAYRAGEKLLDERTGKEHNFSNRDDVVYSNILLPTGSDEKYLDRTYLWNAIERAEKRKDSQVAKDIVLALPKELEEEDWVKLATNFAEKHFTSNGLVADLAIHDHGDGNPHAHIYITTRRLEFDRFGHKARDLNPGFFKNAIVEKNAWGEAWRENQNEYFKAHDIDLIVDENHIIARRHEGRVRSKEAHYLREENKLIKEASNHIALHDPASLLNTLETRYSVFSDKEVHSIVFKSTDSTEAFHTALLKLRAEKDIIRLGPGEDGRIYYTTRNNYLREASLIEQTQALAKAKRHIVDQFYFKKVTSTHSLTAEQKRALKCLLKPQAITGLVGLPGTGKSHLLRAAGAAWQEAGYRVLGVAPTGVAAQGLSSSAGFPAQTLASLQYQLKEGTQQIISNDIIVMDEAGMTDTRDMANIVTAVHQAGAKLVLVGDPNQLRPVGHGAVFRAMLGHIPFAELHAIQRQREEGDREASLMLSQGNVVEAIQYYDNKGVVNINRSGEEAKADLIEAWNADFSPTTLAKRLIITHSNQDVDWFNNTVRSNLVAQGILAPGDTTVNTSMGNLAISVGERLLFLKNDREQGVYNGQFGTVQSIAQQQLTVKLDNGEVTTIDSHQYNHFKYGYAATIHKTQGATLDNTFVYVGKTGWDRHLSYVALTRHRESMKLFSYVADRSQQGNEIQQLAKRMGRYSVKDNVIDWPLTYSVNRGFEPDNMASGFIDSLNQTSSIHDNWLYIDTYEKQLVSKGYDSITTQNERRKDAMRVAGFMDLQNYIIQQSKHMRETSGKKEKFYQHKDYASYLDLQRNLHKLAAEMYQDVNRYLPALLANNIDIDKLGEYSSKHRQYMILDNYLSAKKAGNKVIQMKNACIIYPSIQLYKPLIGQLANRYDIEQKTIYRALGEDFKRYNHLSTCRGADIKAHREVRLLNDYIIQSANAWQRYFELVKDSDDGGDTGSNGGNATIGLVRKRRLAYDYTRQRNKLANAICQNLTYYQSALESHNLSVDKVYQYSKCYIQQSTLEQYVKAFTNKQYRVCESLSRIIYPSLNEYKSWIRQVSEYHGIEAKIIYQSITKSFESTQRISHKINQLKERDQNAVKIVNLYNEYRIQSAKAWHRVYAVEQHKDNLIRKGIYDKKLVAQKTAKKAGIAKEYTQRRNELAYQIASSPSRCNAIIEASALSLSDLEKHALAHRDTLEGVQSKPIKKSRSLHVKKGNSLNYQTVNDALLAQGQAFYERVLGFEGKREGVNHIRFGQGHALVYAHSGAQAGAWHSFSSGEGGGPIQLLMSTQHGWGLKYKEAIEQGARMAGLGLSTPIIDKPPVNVIDEQKSTELNNNEIKRKATARYYFNSAESINGTIAEKYLRHVRGITGSIGMFRYHPRVRDALLIEGEKGGQYKTSYHPALVLAARNQNHEVTAVQTILLDYSGNKINKNSVGAIKRTRGVVKGSAAAVHLGGGKQVIIAEGPETAASLINIVPDANIYVTFGNIKNAANLGWLAKKHGVDAFYFAADNDKDNKQTIKAINDTAKKLKQTEGIDCYYSLPKLNGQKCDYNDILLEKGEKTVKEQLYQWIKIDVPKQQQSLPKETILHNINQNIDEWKRLEAIQSPVVTKLVRLHHYNVKNGVDPIVEKEQDGYLECIDIILDRKYLCTKIEKVAPNLLNEFKKQNQSKLIEFMDVKYEAEWDKLRQSDASAIKLLCSQRDKLSKVLAGNSSKNTIEKLENTLMKVMQTNKQHEFIKNKSKLLYNHFNKWMKIHLRHRSNDIDR